MPWSTALRTAWENADQKRIAIVDYPQPTPLVVSSPGKEVCEDGLADIHGIDGSPQTWIRQAHVDHTVEVRLELPHEFGRRLLISRTDGCDQFGEFGIIHVRFRRPQAFLRVRQLQGWCGPPSLAAEGDGLPDQALP